MSANNFNNQLQVSADTTPTSMLCGLFGPSEEPINDWGPPDRKVTSTFIRRNICTATVACEWTHGKTINEKSTFPVPKTKVQRLSVEKLLIVAHHASFVADSSSGISWSCQFSFIVWFCVLDIVWILSLVHWCTICEEEEGSHLWQDGKLVLVMQFTRRRTFDRILNELSFF